MTAINATQLATITVDAATGPIDVTQLFTIAVRVPPPVPSNVSQLFTITVRSNGRKTVQLGPVIPLECWNPCTAYGTKSLVYYIGD